MTVTFRVVNGAWDDDGTQADRIVTLTGRAGDALTLNVDDIPDVGFSPDEGYEMGAWIEEPPLDQAMTEDATYTYAYAQMEAASAAEEEPTEQPTEEPVEQPAEESVEQPVEEPAEQPAEEPSGSEAFTITFNGGGGIGEMQSEEVENGSSFTLPECAYQVDGCIFAGWEVATTDGEALFTCQPGEAIVIESDLNVTACWAWVETAADAQNGNAEGGEIVFGDENDGLPPEEDEAENRDGDASEGILLDDVVDVNDELEEGDESVLLEEDSLSIVGSVFRGSGVAAIIAAAALVIAAVAIAVVKKRRNSDRPDR